jgi:hypothetical protein
MVNFLKFYSLRRKSVDHSKAHPMVAPLGPLSLLAMHAMGVPAYHLSVRVAEIIKILPIGAGSCGSPGQERHSVRIMRPGAPAGRLGARLSHLETSDAAVVPQSTVQGRLCCRPGLVRTGLSG